ncbi:MAG: LacI family DNA-binding transcriptional regulator [Sphaerochaeta sp.]|uniref:LacI family DNA-binding transcriptional regulator n=1 Tax=Sphaerochaeta sp. TaxID=1972642 RepID=UPI002FC7EDE5
MATLKDIAERCNVSLGTVSRILNEDTTLKVTQSVRNAVLQTAQEVGYVPQRLRNQHRYTIAFTCAPIAKSGYEQAFFARLERLSAKFDVQLSYYTETQKFDGLIVLGDFAEEQLNGFSRNCTHLLLINSQQCEYKYDRIIMDYDNAEEQVLSYFLAKGIEDIGYFGGIHQEGDAVIGQRRLQYFKKLLQEHSVYQQRNFVIGTMDAMSGYFLVKTAKHIPRAMLISDCAFAEGALRGLKEIGSECEVVVYQDMESPVVPYEYPYATLQIFSDAVFHTAVKLLIERMSGERDTVFSITVPAKLIPKFEGETK